MAKSGRSLREKAIAEFRGYSEPRKLLDGVQSVAASLAKAMLGLGLASRVQEAEVIGAWAEIVGPFLAANSHPSRLRDGVLYVNVLQPTVHFELERVWKKDIIQKLKKRLGATVVKDVKFRLG